jgi:ATP-binding cassette, subfamily B, bacterial MsbA
MQNVNDIDDGLAIYRRLLTYSHTYLWMFVISVVCMIIYAATDTGLAALMKPMLDGGFVDKDPQWISLIPVLIIVLALVRGAAGFLSSYSMTWIGRQIIKELRRHMFDQLLHLPTSFYDTNSSGKLLAKFTFDVEQVARAATDAITVVIRDSLTIIGLLAWMFYLNWALTLVFLVIGPLIASGMRYVNVRFRRLGTQIQASMGDVASVSEEAIEGHRVIKTFGGKQYEAAHFEQANEKNRGQNMKMTITSSVSINIIQLIAALALAGIVYLTTGPLQQEITVGSFMSFITAMMMLLAPMKRLTTINIVIQRAIAAAKSVFDLLDTEKEKDTGTETIERIQGIVEYDHVSFSYDRKEAVLQDISFRIERGQTIAIVGRSGSGKTTLVNLLPRFYDISHGNITLDGIDIRKLTLENLRSHLAVVGQDVTLFNDTIAHNIAYGRLDHSPQEKIDRAAEAANAMEFISQLPEGMETVVGENGVLLSGGQRQRLAIARAILMDAPVLILDEATSSLDSESERHIQQALETLMKNRTTLVIAHRLSTIENADMILVLDGGRIVETGKHEQLLAQGKHYAYLYRMQFHSTDDKMATLNSPEKSQDVDLVKKGRVG